MITKEIRIFIGVIIILNGCKFQNDEHVLSYLINSNKIITNNIKSIIIDIHHCSDNKYYVDYVNLYIKNIDSAIVLIKNDEFDKVNLFLENLKKKEIIPSSHFEGFDLLESNSFLSKELSINRLLNIEYKLIYELYSMKVRSNFEINGIKLYAIEDKKQLDDTYKAQLVLIGNTEKKYTVIIDNDTLKNYSIDNYPIYKTSAQKKGLHTKDALVIIERWGVKSKFPLKFSYIIK